MTLPKTQNKLHLFKPKSKLAFAEQMSSELLSDITDREVQEYISQYADMESKKTSDIGMAQEEITNVRTSLNFLFGEDSKEVKYIDKALMKGNTTVDIHYGTVTTPNRVIELIEQAKTKVGTNTVSKGLGETDMNKLNDSIKHLTENGYVFGRDFTTHNAIDIAQASYFENVMAKGETEHVENLLSGMTDCKKCNTTPSSFTFDSMSVSCECYESTPVIFSFEGDSPKLKRDTVNS